MTKITTPEAELASRYKHREEITAKGYDHDSILKRLNEMALEAQCVGEVDLEMKILMQIAKLRSSRG